MRPILRPALPMILLLLAAGCGRGRRSDLISRERFVLANAALREVPDTVAKGDSLRRAALRRYRVTPGDLRRFAAANGRRPQYMAEVWRDIADSVQHRFERSFPSHRDGQVPVIPSGTPAPVTPVQPLPPGNAPPGQPLVVAPPERGPTPLRRPLPPGFDTSSAIMQPQPDSVIGPPPRQRVPPPLRPPRAAPPGDTLRRPRG